MEIILDSINNYDEKRNNLTYTFNYPINLKENKISLAALIYYNFFPNILEESLIIIIYQGVSYNINFEANIMLNVYDINSIVQDVIKKDIPDLENKLDINIDLTRFKCIINIMDDFSVLLDDTFKELLGFQNSIYTQGLNFSENIPKVDRTKYLKIYSNIIDDKDDPGFLTNVYIEGDQSELVVYRELTNIKEKPTIDGVFNSISINILNQNREKITMKDYYMVSLYIS